MNIRLIGEENMNLLKKDIVSGILIALLFAIVSSTVQVNRADSHQGSAAPANVNSQSIVS